MGVFDTGGYIGYNKEYLPITKNGLILHLDAGETLSYPGSGTTWFDLSGNGNNATLYNDVTWTKDNGGAFIFNGTNQYAQCPAGFANFTGGITIFAIVNMGSASNFERIIDFGNGNPNGNIVLARNSTTNRLSFYYFNGTVTTAIVDLGVDRIIYNNTNACYAATANGTTVEMYRNGSSLGTLADTDLPTNVTRNNCYIGRSNWVADSYFESTMSVIMIYNRALSASEITQNYNAYKKRFGI